MPEDITVVKSKPTLLKEEIKQIWADMKKYPVAKDTGIKLISKLKSERDGRGKVPEETLNQHRKAFQAIIDALSEGE